MKRTHLLPLLTSAFIVALAGCGETKREPLKGPNGEPVIYTSIPPLANLAEKIAGDEIEVRSLIGESQDPHDFSPSPKQLVDLSNAAAFITTGMPFEELLVEKLQDSAKNLKFVDVTKGIELHAFDEDDHHDHGHDDHHDHDHDHGETDPHIWLSPPLLIQQIEVIAEALEAIAPEHAAVFQERRTKVKKEIEALHAELSEKLSPLKGQKFYVYHGAFAYFADAYGLVQEAIEVGGRKPEQKRIIALIDSAKADGVKTIFVQPQFDPDSAKTIAKQIGGEVAPIDPMDPDVMANLRKIAEAISALRTDG